MKSLILLLFLLVYAQLMCAYAQDINNSRLKIHTDFIVVNNDDKPTQDIFFESDSTLTGSLNLSCYKYKTATDSVLISRKIGQNLLIKKGINKCKVDYSLNNSGTYLLPSFFEAIKRTELIPPGSYKICISIKYDTGTYSKTFLRTIDSTIPANSSVCKAFNKTLLPQGRSFLGIGLSSFFKPSQQAVTATQVFDRASGKMDKVCRSKGLTKVPYQKNGKKGVYLFYQDQFMGSYEVKQDENISKQILARQQALTGNDPFHSSTGLEDQQSVFSQVKNDNSKTKKENKETTGEIGITTSLSSGQEQYSQTDNNYLELRGRLETEVMSLPVSIEGMYTTQDKDRLVKASYLRMHYDIDKYKDQLSKTTNSYNKQFSETVAKAKGTDQIYENYLTGLQDQQTKLQAEIAQQMKISPTSAGTGSTSNDIIKQKIDSAFKSKANDTASLKRAVAGDADTSSPENKGRASAVKDSTEQEYRKLQAKYERLNKLEAQIERYKILLAQNKNTAHFDSILAYNKTKDMGNVQDMSYKQMAQKADNLLPDGTSKKFIAGLTNLDAGVFPKYASQYTMSGQTLKGLDMGYNFGFVETGITLGRTEYVGRDGSLDKYNCYSGRLIFKPFKAHKIGLIYYGYTPSQQMLSGGFFKNVDASLPSFREPVHIISLNYEAVVSKYLKFKAEAATSFQNGQHSDVIGATPQGNDRSAYTVSASGSIPHTGIQLETEVDKTGNNFQNNTLPVTMNGTEIYKFSYKEDLLHSFLSVGIDYNYLLQSNFSSTGSSTKWGFNIKTNTKRYPSVSISYKPFTTFTSYSDTLGVPQHPLTGSVWTSKASYQFKRSGRVLRFSFIYNVSKSNMDSGSYKNDLMQFSTTYTKGKLMANVNVGNTQMSGTMTTLPGTAPMPTKTDFISISGSYMLNKQLSISGGQDIGFANFGFCRYAFNCGTVYQLSKLPISARLNLRYNTYLSDEYSSWSKIYSGSMDIIWHIKNKKNEQNKK